MLDFSANGNVIGPPQAAIQALAHVDLSRYPDRSCTALREAIAEHHSVPVEWIVPGNGTTEVIWAVARAFLAPGDSTLVVEPTYGEYVVACGAVGARVHRVDVLRPRSGANPAPADIRGLRAPVEAARPRVVWLCHPNNPTGAPMAISEVRELLALAPEALFVIDEAYLTLSSGVESCLPLVSTRQVMVLRSLTKDRALAGIRIGYGVAHPSIADAVAAATPPWSVNSLAQAAGIAAIADGGHLERARAAVAQARAHLVAGLRRLGLCPYPSVANFVLVPIEDGRATVEQLLARGYAVRDCTSFGLPDCIRIGVRTIADQEELLTALAQLRPAQSPS